jgi:hypothetical protein
MAALEEIRKRLKQHGIVVSDKEIGDLLKRLTDDFHVAEDEAIRAVINHYIKQKAGEDQQPAKERGRPPKDNRNDNVGHKSTHDDGTDVQVTIEGLTICRMKLWSQRTTLHIIKRTTI